jgi:outer membrane protein
MRKAPFTARLALVARQTCAGSALTAVLLVPSAALAQEGAAAPAAPRVISLAQVEHSALEQQPQVLVARAATSVAQAQADQAFAPLLPQVTGTAAYTRETGNFAPRPGATPPSTCMPTGTGTGTGTGTMMGTTTCTPLPHWNLANSYDYWNFGIAATQLIYDFGQTHQKYRAAAETVEAQHLSERVTRLQVVSGVRKAYFNARAAKELVDVARETLEDQKKHLTQVQGFVQVGTQPQIALAQQKAAVANAQVQLITAQNTYETAKAQLNQAAGLTGGTDYDVGNDELPPVDDEDQPLDVLASKALATRPEMAALEKQHAAQEAVLSSAKGGYGPALSANASATEGGTALDGLVPNWAAGLALTWPIFQGGLTVAQIHQAEAGLQSVDAQRALEELQVRLDIDSARLAVRAAKATISATDDALASAREQLRLAEQRYATGVGSIIELFDAQVAYTSSAVQSVQARYGLASARAQLLAALGRT